MRILGDGTHCAACEAGTVVTHPLTSLIIVTHHPVAVKAHPHAAARIENQWRYAVVSAQAGGEQPQVNLRAALHF